MPLRLDAPIVEVTVYPDRALVTRRGSVDAPASGEHEIVLGRLPMTLYAESLRVTGSGPASAQLLGVDLAAEYHPEAPEEDTRRIQAEIDRLSRELAILDQRIAMTEQQRKWLNALGEQAARGIAYGLIRGTAQADAPGRIFAITGDEQERLTSATLDTQTERKQVAADLEARKRELEAAQGAGGPDRQQATLRVRTAAAGAMRFDVSYIIFTARWEPRYDARVDAQTTSVQFTQQAQVRQWSGEDWPAVGLTVSTARPSGTLELPDDAPVWYLDQRRPAPPPVFAAAKRASASFDSVERHALAAPMMAASEAMGAGEMTMADAEVESAGVAQVFRIGGDVNIPSDGKPHLVGLGDDDLHAKLDYVTAPVYAEGAHLRATTINSTGHLLPTGALYIFHSHDGADEFVGETRLAASAEGAELKLYLGVNDNITVKRELIERDTDKSNLLQGSLRRTTLGYRVTLANHSSAAQNVTLLDRLPVSKHERIKVKPLEMRPQPTSQSKLDQLAWTVALAAGEERRIEWRVLVESPADLDVEGMP